jgi:hypothetical protein
MCRSIHLEPRIQGALLKRLRNDLTGLRASRINPEAKGSSRTERRDSCLNPIIRMT